MRERAARGGRLGALTKALGSCALVGAVGAAPACVSGGTGPTTACTSGSGCLTGTVTLEGFTATPAQVQASLFREFPSTGATALTTQPLGGPGAFAFSGLAPWDHYYVEALASFGQSLNVATIVGPLAVPATGSVDIRLKPAQLSVLEQGAPGAPLEVQSAEAFLFDPSSGAPLEGATVTLGVGGAEVAMPWTNVDGTTFAYSATLPASTPAQGTYTVTSTAPGGARTTWQLVASPPAFTPTVTAPAAGATVPAGQALAVSWPAQAGADEEIVQLFAAAATGSGWTKVYEGAAPEDPDVTTATIPGSFVGPAGQELLLNVSFVKGSCPATADGCVVGELVVPAQITAQ